MHQVGFIYKTVVSSSVPELEFKLFRHFSQNGTSQGLGWPRLRFVLILHSITKTGDQTIQNRVSIAQWLVTLVLDLQAAPVCLRGEGC